MACYRSLICADGSSVKTGYGDRERYRGVGVEWIRSVRSISDCLGEGTRSTPVFLHRRGGVSRSLDEKTLIGSSDRLSRRVLCHFFTWRSWYVINNNAFTVGATLANMGKLKQSQSKREDLDSIFGCLADSRRRELVRSLAEGPTPMGFETAARQIREREKNEFEAENASSDREIRISLVHRHLPMMAEAEIVTVDSQSETIREGPRFAATASHLESV